MNQIHITKQEGAPLLEVPREIPKEEWLKQLDLFTAQHHGWKSSLEVMQPGQPSRFEARDLPFDAVNVDVAGSDKVEITMEKDPNDRVMHTISHARKIVWQSPDELDIEGDDGERLHVQCQPPAQA